MSPNRIDVTRHARLRPARVALLLGVVAAVHRVIPAHGHEGHAALPTKGATVEGNQILLTANAREALGLEVAKVALGDVHRVMRAQAKVQLPWSRQAMITTLVPGRIERVLVRPGDAVVSGQELARVESLELEAFQREMLRAVAEHALAKRLLEHQEELGRTNTSAHVVVLKARRSFEEATSRLAITTQKLRALGLSRETIASVRTTGQPQRTVSITSPITGMIRHADVRVGQVVTPTEHLFHVLDLSEVEIVGELLESDVGRFRIGQAFTATFASLPGKVAQGRIEHSHQTIESKARTLSVLAHVDNRDHALRPAMSGLMEIRAGTAEGAIVCPTDALIEGKDDVFVMRLRGEGRYERRRVKIGTRAGNRVEISDGLFPGDYVVVTGKHVLISLLGTASEPTADALGPRPVSPLPVVRGARQIPNGSASAFGARTRIVAQATVELPTDRKRFANPRIEGRIAKILVHSGDQVREGQILAEIDSLSLRNLQLDLVQARVSREWCFQEVSRLRALAPIGASPKVDLWRAEAELQILDNTLAALRAKLLAIGLTADDLRKIGEANLASPESEVVLAMTVPIRAPLSGRLEHFEVVPGQVVRPSDAPFEVHDASRLWIKGYVLERDAARVRIGDEASVTFPSLPGRTVTGALVRIAPELGPGELVLPVWGEVDNPDGLLFEGAQASMTIASPLAPGDRDRVARRGR
ncbi:efflux RND transporter periplasmic adaptor subunit [Singulisphaera sp. Ch08]|uniref:Efflux RND transporter periplasmic adaptor subunit n=1 Tax=Singulisphaera sp. Ch08 TaxID=3120278 RepID=A0AAU7CG69_9BACT